MKQKSNATQRNFSSRCGRKSYFFCQKYTEVFGKML
jgi:hypothetical protein